MRNGLPPAPAFRPTATPEERAAIRLARLIATRQHEMEQVLKPFGLVAGKGGGRPFAERVRSLVAGGPLQEVAEALLAATWLV